LLGSPRVARRFSAVLDEQKDRMPFSVRIETKDQGKRYVKEREI
jgi:hypothetical protein